MARIILALLALLIGAQVTLAETVYMYVDENGNKVFTDEPRKGAEELDVKPIPTVPALPTQAPQKQPPKAGPFRYNEIVIVTPADQHNFINESAPIVIQAAVSPNLRTEDKVQLLLNGSPHGAPISSTSFTLENLERGEYKTQVRILDKDGKELGISDTVTFQVKRFSKNLPGQQPPPKPKPKASN
ncbi:MAG TPA: DUF4124 domain-containing protein [Dongiaceae bacterium]|nr:DUF4124 domain-containing protein [Dongiaceae bacterium]